MVFVIVVPFLGVLIYLIAQHDGMRERSIKQAQAQQAAFDRLRARHRRRLGGRDRQGQGAARLGRDHPGGVRRDQGEGALQLVPGLALTQRRGGRPRPVWQESANPAEVTT